MNVTQVADQKQEIFFNNNLLQIIHKTQNIILPTGMETYFNEV